MLKLFTFAGFVVAAIAVAGVFGMLHNQNAWLFHLVYRVRTRSSAN